MDAGTTGHTFTITVQNTGVSRGRQRQPHRHGRLAADRDGRRRRATSPARTATAMPDDHLLAGAPRTRAPRRRSRSPTASPPRRRPRVGLEHGERDRRRRRQRLGDRHASTITTHADVADLKVAAARRSIAGRRSTYTITVTNNGPSDAQSVTLTDTLDPHLTGAKYCARARAARRAPPGPARSTSARSRPARPSTSSITATVDPSTPEGYEIDNTARSASSTTTTRTTATTSSSTTHDGRHEADLVDHEGGAGDRGRRRPGRLRLHADGHNGGPSDNTGGFTVTDTLAGRPDVPDGRLARGCSAAGQHVTCTNTTGLAAGGDQSFTVHVTVASTVAGRHGALEHRVGRLGRHDRSEPGNNTSNTTHTTVHEDVPTCGVEDRAGDRDRGRPGRLRLHAHRHNNGPSDNAGGFHVTDTLDSGLTFQTARLVGDLLGRRPGRHLPQHHGPRRRCGQVFTVHVTLDSTVDSGTDLATPRRSPPTARRTRIRRTRATRRTPSVTEDVQLTRRRRSSSRRTVTAGGAASTFTVDVTNSGVSDADNLSLTDTVDARLIVDSVTAGSYTCTDATESADDHLLARRTSRPAPRRSITVTYHVASTTNSARASANTARRDVRRGPATDTDSVDIVENVHAERHEDLRLRHGRPRRRGRRRSRSSQQQRRLGCRQRPPHRHGRLAADRRLDRRAATTTVRQRRQPVDLLLARCTWRRARRSRSPSTTTSPRRPNSAASVDNTRQRVLGRGHGDDRQRHGRRSSRTSS